MEEQAVKPRIRVPARRAETLPQRPAPSSGYLRDTRSAIISARPAILRESRDEIRLAWRRAAGIALDLIQNSGRLRGAADQVIADTVGVELVLNPQPDLRRLGYDEQETAEFSRLVKAWWKRWSWSPRECDYRGKLTVPQMVDVALRWDMAFGEATAVIDHMGPPLRRRYGIRTGTKICMKTPMALVQDTSEYEGLYQGVIHDENGRVVAYRFQEKEDSVSVKRDYEAFDRFGRQVVVHVFDPMDAGDVRGISRMAAGFRKYIQHEILVDATIQTAVLQTVFAAALTSPNPSAEAFEAVEELGKSQDGNALRDEFRDYFLGTLERAAEGSISISGDPRVSHLAPGEDLKLLSTGTPGPQFLPLSNELSRDAARAIGITFGGFTMNYEGATYSSVRMENSAIWPIVLRRRERIAAPIPQVGYEAGLEEAIAIGDVPLRGGLEAFRANRDRICWALWQGPAKPTADDGKSAKASSERLLNGTSTLAAENAELGQDPDEVFEQRVREHKRYIAAGMPSPFVARNSGGRDAADEAEKAKAE